MAAAVYLVTGLPGRQWHVSCTYAFLCVEHSGK